MSDIYSLSNQIKNLEDRIQKLESIVLSPDYLEDKILMDELYNMAKKLVAKHQKASAIFLQKKLLIDFNRATKLMDRLKKEGIV